MRSKQILLTAAFGLIMSASAFGQSTSMPALKATPAPPTYTLTEIAPGENFEGRYMNAFGEVVGRINNGGIQHAAVYVDGKLIDLSTLFKPGIDSTAEYINLQKEICFFTFDPTQSIATEFQCYTLKNGHLTHFTSPPGTNLNSFGGLNDFGLTVGFGINLDATGTVETSPFGFFAGPNGIAVKLSVDPLSIGYGNSINNVGQICGFINSQLPSASIDTGYLRQPNGELIPLPNIAVPVSINQLGHICGYDNSAANVYLYAQGKSTNLGKLPGYPSGDYFPTSVNDFDTVVGFLGAAGIQTGWVYTNGQMYDLEQSVPGQTLTNIFVLQILDDGRILLTGDSPTRTFVLSPIKKALRP